MARGRTRPVSDARRGLTLFLILATVASALLLLSGFRQFAPVQDALGGVILPVQRVLSPVTSGVRDFFAGLTPGSTLRSKNESLQAEVDRLTAENARLRQLQLENEQLRQQLGFAAVNPSLRTLNARVVGRDPSSLRQYLVVDQGREHGVARGMAVVHPGGALVGTVLRTEATRSEVLLLTDVESSVNAKIERTRADGIVEGRWQQGAFLTMRYIQQGPAPDGAPRVQEGDWVVTSGLGGNVTNNLLIGRVKTVKQSDTGLEQQAEVLPAIDPRSVETVLITLGP